MSARPMRTGLAALAALAVLVALAGCGDQTLWARYRAEREFWHGRRLTDRLQLNPQSTTDAEYGRAEAVFRDIVRRFPARDWCTPERLADPRAADVATLSGRAAIALARLAELRGRESAALQAYLDAEKSYAVLRPVALEAALGRARALERAGRQSEANAVWIDIADRYPPVDPKSGEAILPVLDAPLRVARSYFLDHRTAAGDSVLQAASARYREALETARGGQAAPQLWSRLAEARAGLHDLEGARSALRSALAEPAAGDLAPRLVLTLGERSLQGGQPDSALAYARWAERGFGGEARPEGILLAARAWEAAGKSDSALAAYDAFIDEYSQAADPVALARFRRGRIFEQRGQWEQARTEYRTLIAQQPTQDLSFTAMERIVDHHLRRGENQLARIEGRRAIETLDHLVATQRDNGVQLQARQTRARILLAIGDDEDAVDALTDLWRRYPESPAGVAAAIRAAQLAETSLHDSTRALELYEDLAARAGSVDTRRAAEAAAKRLRRERG